MHDDSFKADYAEARQAAFKAGMSRVQALTGKAIETLDELLGEKDEVFGSSASYRSA